MELVVASNNKGKIKEFKEILEPLGFSVYSLEDKNIECDIQEIGETFEENAIIKAEAIYNITHSCVISDDSGLEVESLNNEPGIFSARYKGLLTEHERRLAVLNGLGDNTNRNAKFTTCICYIDELGLKHIFNGYWRGTIGYKEEGTNGFGYDSIFIPFESNGLTTASMPIEFKEKYSHRSKAVNELLEYLNNK